MKIYNIKSNWGAIVYLDSPEEFFTYSADYWRNLAYDRKLLIFKKVNFTKSQYSEFSFNFGKPWAFQEYSYSKELKEIVKTKHGDQVISPFSNKLIHRIPPDYMPWHADIPNKDYKPYPFRSLWITSNPNPENSGKTSWLHLEEDVFNHLTPKMLELIDRVNVIQQSWYVPGEDVKEFPLVKIHPNTGKKSIRLNHYNWETNKKAWIIDVKIDGVSQGHCFLIREWLNHLEKIPELVYEHQWDLYDIVLYDNHSFVHSRSALKFDIDTAIRHFYRINIDHLTDEEWQAHKDNYFKP